MTLGGKSPRRRKSPKSGGKAKRRKSPRRKSPKKGGCSSCSGGKHRRR